MGRCSLCLTSRHSAEVALPSVGFTPRGSCSMTQLLDSEGFLEGSLKEVLLRRVLRRHFVRLSVGTEVLRRVLRAGKGVP